MRKRIFLLSTLLLLNAALGVIGPVAYLNEKVIASYYPNGTLISSSSIGYAEVGVPNTQDVLQYLRLNLTGTLSRTNLLSNVCYQSVAASPNFNFERTRLFHNTSVSDADTTYAITDANSSPAINATILVTNLAGGKDIYSNDNIWVHYPGTYSPDVNLFSFQVLVENPSTWRSLGNTNVTIVFQQNPGPSNEDAVNITTNPVESVGSAYSVDSDTDGYNETILWTGAFTPGMTLTLDFNGTITEGFNFPNATTSLNLNGLDTNTRGARFEYINNTSTLTELSFSGKFTRGPTLQGIDMVSAGPNWRVRSFFENVANSTVTNKLTYNVSEYRLYNVTNTTGAPDIALQTKNPNILWQQIVPGTRRYTSPWVLHSGSNKPYFTPYFDWQIMWNDTWAYYEGRINTSLQFQTLQLVDVSPDKTINGVLIPYTQNGSLTISDSVTYIGSGQIDLDRLHFNSTVPHLLDNGSPGGLFTINTSTINLTYTNITSTYDIDSSSTTIVITHANPTLTSDGWVNATISDIATTNLVQGNAIGKNLTTNEYISLNYDVLSNSTMAPGYNFTFNGTSTAWSHTPLKEKQPLKFIIAAPKRMTAYKELIAFDPNNPTYINATIRIDVTDKSPSNTGISGIKFVDYLPNGTDFSGSTPIYASFYSMTSNSWVTWTKSTDYNQTNLGWVTLSDGHPAEAWEYTNWTNVNGWHLYDNESIIFKYQFNVTDARVYTLPTQIAGFDPDTGADLSTTAFGVINVIIPEELLEPEINEGELSLSKFVTVGKPAEWIKMFEVYNPNMRTMTAEFETKVFSDTVKAYATYTDLNGDTQSEKINYEKRGDDTYVSWKTTLMPFETRTYYVKVLTPAMVSIDKEIVVLEKISDDVVKLRLNIDLKNLAQEEYPLVRLYLPIRSDQILSATDSLGNDLEYSGLSAVLQLPEVKPLEARSVTVDFKESYPIVIVTPDKEEYGINSQVNLNIRIINGGERVEHPFIETEVYTPYEDTIYSNIAGIPSLGVVEMGTLDEAFVMPWGAPTGLYVASARFREDFNVISTGDASFNVTGGTSFTIIGTIILIGAIIGIGFLGTQKYRDYKKLK